MKKMSYAILMATLVLVVAAGPVFGECTEIWIDQATGINDSGTPGTPEDPFKSITYALAIADDQGWAEPWCVYIRPGVYDADPVKPPIEREIFPIELGPQMVFEGTDRDACIIDGQHFTEGYAALLYGNDLIELQIRNLTLRNMDHSNGHGGALELIECSGLLENCTIENCSALSGGGMRLDPHSAPDETFSFNSCTFSGNTTTSWSGGGLRVTPGPLTGNFTDCTFADNHTAGRGGAFSVDGSLTGDLTGCTVTGNTASSDRGAGIEINGTLTGNIRSCTFSSNSSICQCDQSKSGGGFYIHGSMHGNIVACNFTDNTVAAYRNISGGGFRISGTMNGDIAHCSFVSNSVNSTYGCFQFPGTCYYASAGGGFYVDTMNGAIDTCTFATNTVYAKDGARGGAFYAGSVDGLVIASIFTGNAVSSERDAARAQGAGFFAGALSNGITDCTFMGNSAEGYGGGFYVNGNLSGGVSNSSFSENQAGYNGSGFFANANLSGDIVDCTFANNQGNYASFYVNGALTGDVRRCEFANDERLLGNFALRINGTFNGIMEHCRFFGFPYHDVLFNNTNSSATVATVVNCLFVDPKEALGTGTWGIATNQRTIISNNTMIGPGLDVDISPAALNFGFGTPAEDSEVYNNIIVQTEEAINVDTMVDMPIQYNLFDDVDCIVVQGEGCLGNDIFFLELLLDNFRFNKYEDPLFIAWPTGMWTVSAIYNEEAGQTTFSDAGGGWIDDDLVGLLLDPHTTNEQPLRTLIAANTPSTITVWGDYEAYGTTGNTYEISDYHLAAGSPAVDSANNAVVPPDSSDLDEDGDTAEPTPFDLDGESRFIDDPNTEDTGEPDPDYPLLGIVDMGACELGADCNFNGIADECDVDCGEQGGPCDVEGCGESADCNLNGVARRVRGAPDRTTGE